jgi:hypothetical protein
MSNSKIYDKFEVSLSALKAGAELEDVLGLFPDDREQLKPLLETSVSAWLLNAPAPEESAIVLSRARILHEADRIAIKESTTFLGWRIPRLALAVTFVLLILIFGAGGLLVTSAKSLPGDQTYPLKLVIENLRLQISPGSVSRPLAEAQFEQRRVNEVQHLLDSQRLEPVRFSGTVEDKATDFWIVGDILVSVSSQTTSIGDVGSGAFVEITGHTNTRGWVDAQTIRMRLKEIVGLLEEINPNELIVSGQLLTVDTASQIDPRVNVGDQVIALVESQPDGQLWVDAVVRMPISPLP